MRKIVAAVAVGAAVILCGCDSLFNDVQKIKDPTPMTRIAGGTFTMGAAGLGEPLHLVTLGDYYMGTTEVTYKEWLEVYTWAVAHGYIFWVETYDFEGGRQGGDLNDTMDPVGTDQHPVTSISWQNAVAWCNALSEMKGRAPVYYYRDEYSQLQLYKDSSEYGSFSNTIDNDTVIWDADGYRLPTEAEWEYAARKRGSDISDGAYYSGYDGTSNTPGDYAWYGINSGNSTHEVALKKPNWLGIYDMTGNVWEYCWNSYESLYTTSADPLVTPLVDPLGPMKESVDSCVVRGGSWSDDIAYIASAYRYGDGQHKLYNFYGFRIVRAGD